MSYINNFNPRRMIWFNQSAPQNKMDLWLSYNRHNSEDDETVQTIDNPNQRNCDLILKAWDCGEWIPIVGFNTTSVNKINVTKGVSYSCTTPNNIAYSVTGNTKFHLPLFRGDSDSPDELFDAGTPGEIIQYYVTENDWTNIITGSAFSYAWEENFTEGTEAVLRKFTNSSSIRKGWTDSEDESHATKPNFVLNGSTTAKNYGRFLKLKDVNDPWRFNHETEDLYGETNNCFDWVDIKAGDGVDIVTSSGASGVVMVISSTGSNMSISGRTETTYGDYVISGGTVYRDGSGVCELQDWNYYEISSYKSIVINSIIDSTNPIYIKTIGIVPPVVASGLNIIDSNGCVSGSTLVLGANYLFTIQFNTLKIEKIEIKG